MGEGPELSLREALASAPDPRHPQGRRHPLAAILALAVGAMLGDGRSLYAKPRGGGIIRNCPKPWVLPGRRPLASLPCILFSGGWM